MPKTPISFKFDQKLIDDIKKIAEADSRAVNNLVEKILKEWVKENKPKK